MYLGEATESLAVDFFSRRTMMAGLHLRRLFVAEERFLEEEFLTLAWRRVYDRDGGQ